ncbi:MAG: ATP-dependent helicase HrpB [Bacteroidales bacterium]|nr:ATP-dependent helicase HrpB [Bacteroidales bacterium]
MQLPAAAIADKVNQQLAAHNKLVVTAPPGAGKSTLLPVSIMQALTDGGKVLMLEPRRLAARQIAERLALNLGEPVGRTVGYRIRFESKVSDETRIEVLTEGILTRRLISDPMLDGVSVVLFDEFHERSLNTDVALALTREIQQLVRPDLRIVLMSATIDTTSICQALDAPCISCEGRMFPIETLRLNPGEEADVAGTIRKAHRQHEGDILVFLPGEAEIRSCQEQLGNSLGATHICPLYGMLNMAMQRQAIAPSAEGERKVVLATPIAETSLTIQGVRVVIDAGTCRKLVFHPQTGLSHLQTVPISLDMADQRRGRAGRVAPGVCYRLWSMADEHRMEPHRTPEILEADLAPMLLDVAAWGQEQAERLPWLTPPPAVSIAQARELLRMLGAIDDKNAITPHGKALSALPCHPRIAQMLVQAHTSAQKVLATDIAALLEERDPLATSSDADLNTRLSALREVRARRRGEGHWSRILRIAEQYRKMVHVEEDNTLPDPSETGALLAAAYPERVAKALPEGKGVYRLASGGQAQLPDNDVLEAQEWLAVASLHTGTGRGRIFLASPLRPQDLEPLLKPFRRLAWDSTQGQLVAQTEYRVGQLVVRAEPLKDTDPQEVVQLLCDIAPKEGLSLFDFNDSVLNLQRRVAAVASWHPELELPDLSAPAVLCRAVDWLPFYLSKNISASALKKIDLTQALWGLLSYEQQQAVDRLAPTHIQVPTGSRIRVEYRQGAELPVLRVRLQECFGLLDTPRVDDGQRPVLLELLSPGFKPVQLTSDLRSFWEGTYFEVRKELRRRYPKHAWPDNPLEADPVRGVKKR